MGKILTVKPLPPSVKRGDIYFADFSDMAVAGCEQSGTKPVIIIQNDKGNKHSTTTIVAILTTKFKNRWLPTHVVIPHFGNLPRNSMACLEQIKTIDKSRLHKRKALNIVSVSKPFTVLFSSMVEKVALHG